MKIKELKIVGLDVYLYRLPDLDTGKIALYYKKYNQIISLVTYKYNEPQPTEKEITEFSRLNSQLLLEIGLPFDIHEQISEKKQEIEIPSIKYPQEYQIGYWRSGYSGGGIDTVLKVTIGSGLYDAFPEATEWGGYLKPDWERSLQILRDMLIRFQSKGFEDQNFLDVTGFSIELGQDFVASLTPSSPEHQALLTELEDAFTPQSQFNDYVKEIEAIVETVEYVLTQPDKDQYMLFWSA
jgi:hypothetical protein